MANSSNSILIVDPEENSRTFLVNSFRKKRWTVHTARDGRHVTQCIRNYLPDIILMVINIPVRNGIATCSIIKNDLSLPRYLPIIMMTASKDKKQIIKAIEAGCDDFILKPFKFDILLDKISKLVDFKVIKSTVTSMIDILHKEDTLPLAFKMKSFDDYTMCAVP